MTGQTILLDPVGGIAGDMFAGAMLSAFPELQQGCLDAVSKVLGKLGMASLLTAENGGFVGLRFLVEANGDPPDRRLADVEAIIKSAAVDKDAADASIGIFGILAGAEAEVHGVDVEDVHFHEVGAIDSIADIVAAGFLIASLKNTRWSIGPLPLGGGVIDSAHGPIPIPAPATALLLKGFDWVDDGILGERVTPTGAAILRFVNPSSRRVTDQGTLQATGIGLGTRILPGRSNMLRTLVIAHGTAEDRDSVATIQFDIDDQTGEDLAVALERLRDTPDVLDVVQWSAIGKRARMVSCVRILCRPQASERIARFVFDETSTIGLRIGIEERRRLRRSESVCDGISVKTVERPSGLDAKAAIGDLDGSQRLRRKLVRDKAERLALHGRDHEYG